MQLIPYIIFNGNCEEALKFYEKALGGTIGQINRYSDMPPGTPSMGMTGDKIMHTDFKVDGNYLFLASLCKICFKVTVSFSMSALSSFAAASFTTAAYF